MRLASAVIPRWRLGVHPSKAARAGARGDRPGHRPRAESLESRLLLAAGPAAIVADINSSTDSGLAHDDSVRWGPGVFDLNGTVVYRASDGVHGLEWWGSRSAADGSPAGAAMLRDIYPGAPSPFDFAPSEDRSARRAVVAGGTLFFSANDGVSGHELWATDGTPAGTRLVADLRTGPGASLPRHFVAAAAGDVVYFTANGDAGPRLYRSDGTAAGTYRMPDFPRSPYYGNDPIPLAPVGTSGALLVAAPANPDSGYELWTTNGTAANTRLVRDIHPGEPGSVPALEVGGGNLRDGGVLRYDLVRRGDGVVFFAATDATNVRRLWRSDGTTAGTFLVGAAAPAPRQLTDVAGTIYFSSANVSGVRTLWRLPAAGGAAQQVASSVSPFESFAAFNGAFYFRSTTGLYRNDPTGPAAATLLKAANNWSGPVSVPYAMAELNGRLYLSTTVQTGSGSGVTELWATDGTASGTRTVHSFTGSGASSVVRSGGFVYFAGANASVGRELFRSDGTAAGTVPVHDVNAVSFSSHPSRLTFLDDTVGLFTADDGVHGYELWRTDGTAAGTSLVADLFPGVAGGVVPQYPTLYSQQEPGLGVLLNGRVYFVGTDRAAEAAVWATDGTPQGTVRVSPYFEASQGSSPGNLTVFRGKLYFTATRAPSFSAPWVTDGTPEGTRRIKDVSVVQWGASTFTPVRDELYFVGYDGTYGSQVWKTDGTEAGTARVSEMVFNPNQPGIQPLGSAGGAFLFRANRPDVGTELWQSDGTAAGTGLLKDLLPGPDSGEPDPGVTVGGRTLFIAAPPDVPGTHAVWTTDGTEAGTTLVYQVPPGAIGSNAFGLTAAGAAGGDFAYFFTYSDATRAHQLHRTDGTAGGTRVVATLAHDGPLPWIPLPVGVAGGVLYFRMYDATGEELWRSDGTDAGTFRVQDLRVGPNSSTPVNFSAAPRGDRAYFAALDDRHGVELWSMPLPAAGATAHVFYNHSAFDGRDPDAHAADDAAVAPDKAPLRPGRTATFANVTSYSRGINGVIIDLPGVPAGVAPTLDDFDFGGAPAPRQITLRRGAGTGGTDRVTLVWPDHAGAAGAAVANGWLTITVKPTDRTGLNVAEVFSFGNLVGETPAGGAAGARVVNVLDVAATRGAVGPATLTSAFDFDRDGRVAAADVALARTAQGRSLLPLGPPPPTVSSAARVVGSTPPVSGRRDYRPPRAAGVAEVLGAAPAATLV